MNRIFVFGANEAGHHGRGAARDALLHHGAKYGVGEGLSGSSYAIPTKDARIRTLPLESIHGYVSRFLDFARNRPDLEFEVTRIGCGLAGYSDNEIAPMFAKSPPNCLLPGLWRHCLDARDARVIVVGDLPDSDEDSNNLTQRLELVLERLDQKRLELVCDEPRHANWLERQWARARQIQVLCLPSQDGDRGRHHARLLWYGSHLLVTGRLIDGDLEALVQQAREHRMPVRMLSQTHEMSPRTSARLRSSQ